MDEISRRIRMGINEYNKYRSPEANAELIEYKDRRFRVKFTGPYCRTCGYYDYFEDLVYELLDLGVKSRVVNIVDHEDWAEVEYEVIEEA